MLHDVPTMLGGRYRIVERLGRGGMADVYRAEDVVLRRAVAIKVFRGGVERDVHLARFRAEVRTLAALTHPHLVALYDAGGDVAEPWCAMEYVDGGSLADREEPVPVASVARIGEQIAAGLAYVHSKGIVHRDVKPSNVLLDSDGDAFLSDFGIAKLVDGTRMTQSGLMIGTAAFLSPEQVRGRNAGPPSDVYALGLVLLEALTGRREYPGSPVESAVARLSRQPEVPAELGPDWGDLIRAMTAEAPESRPAPEHVGITLRGIARRLAGLDSLDLVIDLTGDPDLAVVDRAAGPAAGGVAESPPGMRHGAVLFVPKAGIPALPRPLPVVSPVTDGPASGDDVATTTATTGETVDEALRDAEDEAVRAADPSDEAATAVPAAGATGDPASVPAAEQTPVLVLSGPAPRNLLGWLSPERRRRGQLILSAAAVVGVIAVGLPLLDGARSAPAPLRIDSAAGAGVAPSTSISPTSEAIALGGDEQALRRAPVGVQLPATTPYPSEEDAPSRHWLRGSQVVAGTATTKPVPSRTSATVKASPRPSPSISPSPPKSPTPSPSVTPSPTATPTATASPTTSATAPSTSSVPPDPITGTQPSSIGATSGAASVSIGAPGSVATTSSSTGAGGAHGPFPTLSGA